MSKRKVMPAATAAKEETPEYRKVAALKGHGIGMTEAGRKYGIIQPTISRWVKRGLVEVIGRSTEHAQKVLIDEADIAYCAAIYKQRDGSGGRWIFNPDGTPRIPKDLAA